MFGQLGWAKIWQKCQNQKPSYFTLCYDPKCCAWYGQIGSSLKSDWAEAIPTPRWASPSGSPLGVTFWAEIENLCENHIFWANFIFRSFWLLMIFGTLFSKKCPFWANFTQTNICPNHQHIWTKIDLKTILIWFLEDFVSYVLLNGAKTDFDQNFPKMGIFY